MSRPVVFLHHPAHDVIQAALSQQWFDELKKHAPHFRVLVYHGDEKPQGRNAVKTLRDYHVVIASYEAVAGEAPIPKSPKKVDKKKEQGAILLSTSTGGSAPGPLHKVCHIDARIWVVDGTAPGSMGESYSG